MEGYVIRKLLKSKAFFIFLNLNSFVILLVTQVVQNIKFNGKHYVDLFKKNHKIS